MVVPLSERMKEIAIDKPLGGFGSIPDLRLRLLRDKDAIKAAVVERKSAGETVTQKGLREWLWENLKNRGAIAS